MNFNILLFLIFSLSFVSACGVKGDPTSPKTPATASLMQNYPDIETDKPVDDVKRSVKSSSSKK